MEWFLSAFFILYNGNSFEPLNTAYCDQALCDKCLAHKLINWIVYTPKVLSALCLVFSVNAHIQTNTQQSQIEFLLLLRLPFFYSNE